jgi:predicted 3-demethylubiquinone-9 3-methyltransferase (glyoxalase superfamily)
MKTQQMAICLWFDSQAEEAARFYTSIFEDSEIGQV